MIFAVVVPPNKITQGRIFLWLKHSVSEQPWISRNIFKYDNLDETPRAYEIPYTKENVKKINRALQAKKNGMLVDIIVRDKKGKITNRGESFSTGMTVKIIDPRKLLSK